MPASVCANVHQNESLRLIYEPKLLERHEKFATFLRAAAVYAARRLVRAERVVISRVSVRSHAPTRPPTYSVLMQYALIMAISASLLLLQITQAYTASASSIDSGFVLHS